MSVCSIFASCDCYHPHCLYKGGLGHACNTVTLADLILNCCVNLVHLKTFESKSELMGLQCTKLSTNYFNLQKNGVIYLSSLGTWIIFRPLSYLWIVMVIIYIVLQKSAIVWTYYKCMYQSYIWIEDYVIVGETFT